MKRGHKQRMGEVRMVDIGEKRRTEREAVAECRVLTKPEVVEAIKERRVPKGDVMEAAKVAGIMASKLTFQILPLCHPVALDFVGVEILPQGSEIRVRVTVKGRERTGFEMEALFSAAVAALTVYDMCKGLDRTMTMTDLRLVRKSGGRSGEFVRGEEGQ